MPGRASPAANPPAQLRAFELALELGCTPKEAEAELARRESRERWKANMARLHARVNGQPLPVENHDQRPNPRNTPWWLKD